MERTMWLLGSELVTKLGSKYFHLLSHPTGWPIFLFYTTYFKNSQVTTATAIVALQCGLVKSYFLEHNGACWSLCDHACVLILLKES